MHIIQHGLQGLQVKISKISQQRQIILIIFCRSESVASIISIIAIISQTLTLREAFETDARLNEEVK